MIEAFVFDVDGTLADTERECLAFEDSANGLRASFGAGLETVITRNAYTRDDDFTGAALVLDSLGDTEHPSQVLRQQYGRDYLSVTTLLQLLNQGRTFLPGLLIHLPIAAVQQV